MSGPPSAEPDGPPRYRAMIVDADGRVVAQSVVTAPGDDEAGAEAQALADGQAVDLWDDLRFIESYGPMAPRT